MKRGLLFFGSLLFMLYVGTTFAKEIAITIDDLPFVGNAGNTPGNLRRETNRFMLVVNALKENNIPATGFAIGEAVWNQAQLDLLKVFMEGGNIIGNHTYYHRSLNRVSANKYIAGIARTDKIIDPLIEGKQKYFRYPYLAEGNTPQKYFEVKNWLKTHGYKVAPVTVDSKDYRFNARLLHINWRSRQKYLPGIRSRYLHYVSRQLDKAEREGQSAMGRPVKQILLIHMNYLNAYSIDQLIALLKSKGYTIISLKEALTDPYYKKYRNHFSKYKEKYEAKFAQQEKNQRNN